MADVSAKTILAAMGQLFYSMSLAMGIMITYGSRASERAVTIMQAFLRPQWNLSRKIDTIVSINIMDFTSNSVLMPIVAFFTCIFVGFIAKPDLISTEVKETDGTFKAEGMFNLIIKWIAPIFLVLILQWNLSRKIDTIVSISEIAEVSAAKSTSRKKAVPMTPPNFMLANTFGSVMNIRDGPAFRASLLPPHFHQRGFRASWMVLPLYRRYRYHRAFRRRAGDSIIRVNPKVIAKMR